MTAKKAYLDHRVVQKWQRANELLGQIMPHEDTIDAMIAALEPVTPAQVEDDADVQFKGYMASADGRIVLRFVSSEEADRLFGVGGISSKEAICLAHRISNLRPIEDAAIAAQRDAHVLRKALERVWECHQGGRALGPRDVATIHHALQTTEGLGQ